MFFSHPVLSEVLTKAVTEEVEIFDTLLLAASKHGQMDQLQIILTKITTEEMPGQAQEALLLAAKRGYFEIAYLLVKWGAKMDQAVSDALAGLSSFNFISIWIRK